MRLISFVLYAIEGYATIMIATGLFAQIFGIRVARAYFHRFRTEFGKEPSTTIKMYHYAGSVVASARYALSWPLSVPVLVRAGSEEAEAVAAYLIKRDFLND